MYGLHVYQEVEALQNTLCISQQNPKLVSIDLNELKENIQL